jgi:SpoVK/Ycf46/Vps4 family AAA+-type ATPase
LIEILARRRKNNPIIVGEPGVGKTALVEGLARAIASGEVPKALRDVELLELDMGLLQAGAGVRGEFEKRLKGVIEEVKASPRPIVLFIDEAHTIVGGRAGHRRGQPAQAGAGARRAADDRGDHVVRVQEVLREGRGASPAASSRSRSTSRQRRAALVMLRGLRATTSRPTA